MNKEDIKNNFKALFSINKDFDQENFNNIIEKLSEQIADNPNSNYNYIANISQSGTGAPYVTSLGQNTFPVSPIFSYSAAGQYVATFSASLSFLTNGFFSSGVTLGSSGNQTGYYSIDSLSNSSIKIFTYNISGNPTNSLLRNTMINIQQIGTTNTIIPFYVTQTEPGYSFDQTESVSFGRVQGGTSGLDYSLGERHLEPVSSRYGKLHVRMLSASSGLGNGSPVDYRSLTSVYSQTHFKIYAHSSIYGGSGTRNTNSQMSFYFTLPTGANSIHIYDNETSGGLFNQIYSTTSTLTGAIPYNVNTLNALVTFS